MKQTNSDKHDLQPSSNVRSLISLALLIHLFMVAVALSSNLVPSDTQARLLDTFSPYIQPLNLKLSDDFSHKFYHYTHGIALHHDHFLEIEFETGPRAGEVVRLPDTQWRGTANRHRYQSLTRMMAFYQQQPYTEEFLNKLLVQGIAPSMMQSDTPARAIVRIRRHAPMPRDAGEPRQPLPADPTDPVYFSTSYAVNITVDEQGEFSLTKIEDAGQVAPLREEEPTDNE